MVCHTDRSEVPDGMVRMEVGAAWRRDRRAAWLGWALLVGVVVAVACALSELAPAKAGGCGESPPESPQVERPARRCG